MWSLPLVAVGMGEDCRGCKLLTGEVAMRVALVCLLFFPLSLTVAQNRRYRAPLSAREGLRLEVVKRTNVTQEFRWTASSYRLTIRNLTDGVVTIQRGIRVERETPRGWILTDFIQAIPNCTGYVQGYDRKALTSIVAHGVLAVLRWNGWQCGGQCPSACLQNAKAPPGIYRFAVVVVPGSKITSPTFIISRR